MPGRRNEVVSTVPRAGNPECGLHRAGRGQRFVERRAKHVTWPIFRPWRGSAFPYRWSLACGWRSTSRHAGSRAVIAAAGNQRSPSRFTMTAGVCCRVSRAAGWRARAPAARTAT